MGDIAQRGNRLTFAKGGKGGKGEWIEPIKTKAKKDTESVRDVRAGGGRAGHALGHTAGRRLTERGAKSWNKKDFKGSDERKI